MAESTIKEIMTEFVQTIPVGSNVKQAAQIMYKGGIGSIVVTQKGNPVGMLTERDIVGKIVSQDLSPSKVLVEKIMSNPIITIQKDEIIDEAALMMSIYGIRRLVVVDKKYNISGIITTTDIASWLSRNEDYKNNTLHAIVRSHDVERNIPYQ
jgi:CBS domain-containing protein